MDNQQLTDKETGWLAAFVESEGSVMMALSVRNKQPQYYPDVVVVNTDPGIILRYIQILEKLGCRFHVSIRKKKAGSFGNKTIWDVHVRRQESLAVLLPYLAENMAGTKRFKAELMLRWVQSRLRYNKSQDSKYPEEDVKLAESIRKLNDCTRDTDSGEDTVWSARKLAELAEMTSRQQVAG